MQNELVIVVDFGGQYNQLIARRVRECDVYCNVVSYKTSIEKIKEMNPKGIIFTGGPSSVYEEGAPTCSAEIFELGVPVLGICYGNQLMAHLLGGEVKSATTREYGKTVINVNNDSLLFKEVPASTSCWMSHTDYVAAPPQGFEIVAHTDACPVAAIANVEKKLYGVQFHPEVNHTPEGSTMLKNFLYNVCECKGDWKMADFTVEMVQYLKDKIGDKKVLCALSGGVDSSVAAVLIHRAVGKQLTCIFVDHGLLRKNEGDDVERIFRKQFDMNLIRVNA
ncbi:MAG: synthase, large subunit, partial [Clostridiales bacterium]|nr:synthase, large subunit [Clostridiales bacterium]